jgi:hypothetical protein
MRRIIEQSVPTGTLAKRQCAAASRGDAVGGGITGISAAHAGQTSIKW